MEAAFATAMEAAFATAMKAAGRCMRLEPTCMRGSSETRTAARRIRTDDAAMVEAGESAGSKRRLAVELRAAHEGPRARRTMELARAKGRRAPGLRCRVFTEGRPACDDVMPMCERRAMREVRRTVVQCLVVMPVE